MCNAANRSIIGQPLMAWAPALTPESGAEGVLVCCGGETGGYTLFMKDGKLHWEHNWFNAASYPSRPGRRFRRAFDVGCDTVTPVSQEYRSPFAFTGTIQRVIVHVSRKSFEELSREARQPT
ncbi:MAG: hypothetical protein ACRENP_02595 [Longimicrobiales bacterium]